MKQGAAEAEKALVSVGETSKRTARAINLNTESIERKLDAIVDGIAQSNKLLISSQRTVTMVAKETEQALVKTEVASQKFGREIVKAGGIAESVERKFVSLGKAATGMFAVDIASKVLGFSSAMDVLQKATQGVADAFHVAFGYAAMEQRIEAQKQMIEKATDFWDGLRMSVKGYYDELNKNVLTYDFPETQAKIFYPRTRAYSGPTYADDFTEQDKSNRKQSYRYDPPNLAFDISGMSSASVNLLNERILALKTSFDRLSDPVFLREGASNPGFAPRAADFERQQQQLNELYRSLISDDRRIAKGPMDPTRGGAYYGPYASGYYDSNYASIMGEARAPFYLTAPRADGSSPSITGARGPVSEVYEDARRRMLAAEAEARRARMIGLNTGQTALAFGQGGIPDSRWDFGLGYMGGGGFQGSPDTMPIAARNRRDAWLYGDNTSRTDGGYIGALQNRYSPERIAEQFSANFYQSLEASVMTGDFSNFGRSVMQMIGQSLMESIVAAPIQEAMGVLMQALLGNMRGGITGGGGTTGQGVNVQGPPAPPLTGNLMAGGTSTSVAPYRSPKQRYDDLSRRNLR